MAMKAKAALAARATYRAGKRFAKSKRATQAASLLKSQAEESFRKKMADVPVTELALAVYNHAKGEKSPRGADGVNLNAPSNRDVSIPGSAVGDFTTSSSMYMYRPALKRSMTGVNYIQKTRATGTKTSAADGQTAWDISIVDAVPVLLNPDSNEKYSNLTIKKAFDDFLIASNQGTDKLKLQQTSIHMKSLTAEINIRNANSTPCILDLYEVIPKFDLGPTEYSNFGYAVGYMSPTWCWRQGLITDTPQLEDTLALETVGSRPSDSVNFSRSWKVVKRVKVNLTGNSTHIHKMAYAINKTVPYQAYAQFSTSGGKLSGWNPTVMCVLRGVSDTTNPLASAAGISYYSNLQLNYSGYMSEGSRAVVFDTNT